MHRRILRAQKRAAARRAKAGEAASPLEQRLGLTPGIASRHGLYPAEIRQARLARSDQRGAPAYARWRRELELQLFQQRAVRLGRRYRG